MKVEATNISLLIDNSNYKIAVGKHTSDTEFIQTSDVSLQFLVSDNIENIYLKKYISGGINLHELS